MTNGPREPRSDDEVTLADDEWPVAEQYRVEPRAQPPVVQDDAIVVQDVPTQGPVRRFPPDLGPGLLLALLGVLLVVILVPAGIWLAGRDDDDPDAAPTTTLDATTIPATTSETPTTPTSNKVPKLTGLTVEVARAYLDQQGVQSRVVNVATDGPAGRVLRQTPKPGATIGSDTVVVLSVSKARTPEQVTVPSVEGLRVNAAVATLEGLGLVAEIRKVPSSEPKGAVLSQTPGPDEEVAPESVVVIEVSEPPSPPPAPTTIAVPRLVGLTAADARSQLRDLGLRFTQRPVESDRAKGVVVEQSPRAGTRLRKGQAVTLTVSTGPARVSVPDVVGLDEQAARDELVAAGFEVEVTERATDVVEEDGVVLDQDPAAGASRPKGSVVTITIGLFG